MAAVVLSAALVFAGLDGSPWEARDWSAVASAPAVRVVEDHCMSDPGVCAPPTTAPAPVWPTEYGPCAEWAPTAFDVGWPTGQWPTISRVMWCESKCQPGAHNRSGASGLMQIMPMWWAGRDPYDGTTNLEMALEVWHRQGWHAWSCF